MQAIGCAGRRESKGCWGMYSGMRGPQDSRDLPTTSGVPLMWWSYYLAGRLGALGAPSLQEDIS